jgi:hypothetical protein
LIMLILRRRTKYTMGKLNSWTLGASQAVRDLICAGRNQFAIELAGAQFDFDAMCWDVTSLKDRSVVAGSRKLYFTHYQTLDQPLPQIYADVIKSWIVLERQSYISMAHKVDAARVLWKAILLRCRGDQEIFEWEALSEEDFNQAELIMYERKLAVTTIYKQVGRLIVLVNFLAARKVCRQLYYTPQTPRPDDFYRFTIRGQEERMEKLPSMRAIEGLADLYSTRAKQPSDRLLLAAIAILVVTGLRIGELLTLPEDCEIKESRNGRPAYGLRYYVEKTRGGEKLFDIRWLTPIGAELAQKAIVEIKEITAIARLRAKELEREPDTVSIPGLSWEDRISASQLDSILGLSQGGAYQISKDKLSQHRDEKGIFYRAFEVEAYLRSQRVDRLWTLDRKNGTKQMLSETLLIIPRYFLGSHYKTIPLLVEPMRFVHLSNFISRTGRNRTVFERFNICEDDGCFCSVTSHQFRHWLNDMADKGGLPIDVQTRWMGRKNPRDTGAYLHSTVEERLSWVRSGIRSGEIVGPMANVYFVLPESERDAFLEGQIQSVHITPMGICIHDFAIEPCPYHLNCVRGCSEYLRTKGNQKERLNLIQVQKRTEQALHIAQQQVLDGNNETTQAWVHNYEETLEGVKAALAVDDDSSTEDGTVVRPFQGQLSRFRPLPNQKKGS